jgi:hypothetical protein
MIKTDEGTSSDGYIISVNISNILHLALEARAKTVRVVRSANHDLKKSNALSLDVTILLQACMLNFTRCIGWF